MPESVFGESPAGIDISADNHKRNNAAVITTYVLAVVFVALRFYTRFQVQEMQAASEDWMILAAWYVLRTSYAYNLFPLPAGCDCKPRVYYHWYFQRHHVFLFVRSRSDRYIGGHYGLGRHIRAVPMHDITKMVQILFAYVLLYAATIPLIKLSAILFYRRIFGMTKLM